MSSCKNYSIGNWAWLGGGGGGGGDVKQIFRSLYCEINQPQLDSTDTTNPWLFVVAREWQSCGYFLGIVHASKLMLKLLQITCFHF